jgi:4-amino-4-deoxy-L-arabinose transferase-like glycosyltransferase
LFLLSLICLLPFSDKAFHMDDPLFIRAAQQIIKHPFDPYGFPIVWYAHQLPMSRVNQNPPLASYYAALLGLVAGWSERALHLGFILPALVVILGTYRLARRFTKKPFLAAAATLLAPGFFVSATGVMCDTMMLALWILAVIFWMEGLDEPVKPIALAVSSLLIAACALTKYFGVSLIPLLLAYSVIQKRRIGSWVGFLLIPVFLLGAYELGTHALYGRGLLSDGLFYTAGTRKSDWEGISLFGHVLVGLAFAGGCTLPALTFVPFLWSRKQILAGGVLGMLLGFSLFNGWVNLDTTRTRSDWIVFHWALVNSELLVCIAGGVAVWALAVADFWKRRSAASVLLLLWVVGTFCYAILVNWVVNARSLLALIPAAAILIARRFDEIQISSARWRRLAFVAPLVVSGAVSLGVASGDMKLANSSRKMANYIHQKTLSESGAVEFQGHWGFQYYMESFGARPLEQGEYGSHPGDLIVFPVNNTNVFELSEKTIVQSVTDLEVHSWVATMSPQLGAGFYSSIWGPLPFAIGRVPNERYYILRVGAAREKAEQPLKERAPVGNLAKENE